MKRAVALFLTFLLVLPAFAGDKADPFRAEKLTKCEIDDLATAQKVLDEAKVKFEQVTERVKRNHGKSFSSSGWTTQIVTQYYLNSCENVDVELRGDWALISTSNACAYIRLSSSDSTSSTLQYK